MRAWQAVRMGSGYLATLAVIFLLGLGVIVGVAWTARLRDREDNDRLLRPPAEDIPGFDPATPAPEYLTELQLRDTPTGAVSSDLSDADRASVAARLDSARLRLPAGYLSGDFVTDRPSQWAVLDHPTIAWCPDGVGSTRELMSLVAALGPADGRRPLVLLAPSLPGDVVETLRVNNVRRTLRAVPVLLSPDDAAALLALTGQRPLTRAQLASDYVAPEALGACALWVSGPAESWLLTV